MTDLLLDWIAVSFLFQSTNVYSYSHAFHCSIVYLCVLFVCFLSFIHIRVHKFMEWRVPLLSGFLLCVWILANSWTFNTFPWYYVLTSPPSHVCVSNALIGPGIIIQKNFLYNCNPNTREITAMKDLIPVNWTTWKISFDKAIGNSTFVPPTWNENLKNESMNCDWMFGNKQRFIWQLARFSFNLSIEVIPMVLCDWSM